MSVKDYILHGECSLEDYISQLPVGKQLHVVLWHLPLLCWIAAFVTPEGIPIVHLSEESLVLLQEFSFESALVRQYFDLVNYKMKLKVLDHFDDASLFLQTPVKFEELSATEKFAVVSQSFDKLLAPSSRLLCDSSSDPFFRKRIELLRWLLADLTTMESFRLIPLLSVYFMSLDSLLSVAKFIQCILAMSSNVEVIRVVVTSCACTVLCSQDVVAVILREIAVWYGATNENHFKPYFLESDQTVDRLSEHIVCHILGSSQNRQGSQRAHLNHLVMSMASVNNFAAKLIRDLLAKYKILPHLCLRITIEILGDSPFWMQKIIDSSQFDDLSTNGNGLGKLSTDNSKSSGNSNDVGHERYDLTVSSIRRHWLLGSMNESELRSTSSAVACYFCSITEFQETLSPSGSSNLSMNELLRQLALYFVIAVSADSPIVPFDLRDLRTTLMKYCCNQDRDGSAESQLAEYMSIVAFIVIASISLYSIELKKVAAARAKFHVEEVSSALRDLSSALVHDVRGKYSNVRLIIIIKD